MYIQSKLNSLPGTSLIWFTLIGCFAENVIFLGKGNVNVSLFEQMQLKQQACVPCITSTGSMSG